MTMEQQDLRQKTKEKFLNERISLYLALFIGVICIVKALIDQSWFLFFIGLICLYACVLIKKDIRSFKKQNEILEKKRINFLETLKAPDFIGPKGHGDSYIYSINCRRGDSHFFCDTLPEDSISKTMLDGGLIFTNPISFETRKKLVKLTSKKIPFYGNIEKHEYVSGVVETTYYYSFAAFNGRYMEHHELPYRNSMPAIQVENSGEINGRELEKARKFLKHYNSARNEV